MGKWCTHCDSNEAPEHFARDYRSEDGLASNCCIGDIDPPVQKISLLVLADAEVKGNLCSNGCDWRNNRDAYCMLFQEQLSGPERAEACNRAEVRLRDALKKEG